MVTIALVVMGFFVLCGVAYLVFRSGAAGGRHRQSGEAGARAQRQEAARVSGVRATGGGDD
jgi:hypothetical protein